MLDYFKKTKWTQKLKILVIAFIFIPIIFLLCSDNTEIHIFTWTANLLSKNFTQIIGETEIELDNISEFQAIEKGETLVLETTLPNIDNEKVLYFHTKDTEVKVYIDDVEVYSFEMQDEFSFLKTPGNKWNAIYIPVDYVGKTLRIELTSQFENRYMQTLTNINLVNENETLNVSLNTDGFRILMSLVVFLMALMAYFSMFIWKRKEIKKYFFALGNVFSSTALWLFSMYSLFDYLMHKPILSCMVSMIMAVFIPVTIYELVKVVYKKKNKLINVLGCIIWINFVIQMILQFIFKISLFDLLPITYVIYAVGAFLCLILILQHIINYKNTKEINFSFASMIVMFIGAIAEIIVLCALPKRTDLIGVASLTGLFIYLIINQFRLSMIESNIDMENISLEKNYIKLQNTNLMRQMKAHYFFNTLNTISALCKYDAREADRAIVLFSGYMRSYMYLINEQDNIPLMKELNLVENSLKIENLRFPDSFTYTMQTDFTDFKIPPLSIQPIVENSMIHGLRQMNKKGNILIKTQKSDNFAKITISDNGVGFDVSILENTDSIGLKNLKKRIEIMTNGTVQISSNKSTGTTTIITIPLE